MDKAKLIEQMQVIINEMPHDRDIADEAYAATRCVETVMNLLNDEWIRVQDRLPEEKRDYLCYRPYPEEYFVCTYYPEEKVFADVLVIYGITHWCELPSIS